jgi:hypothetical protein
MAKRNFDKLQENTDAQDGALGTARNKLLCPPMCPRPLICRADTFSLRLYFPSALARDSLVMVERSLFRAKINSDYNDFVAWVALEVVDGSVVETATAGKKCGQHGAVL